MVTCAWAKGKVKHKVPRSSSWRNCRLDFEEMFFKNVDMFFIFSIITPQKQEKHSTGTNPYCAWH